MASALVSLTVTETIVGSALRSLAEKIKLEGVPATQACCAFGSEAPGSVSHLFKAETPTLPLVCLVSDVTLLMDAEP